jgi:ribosomal protein S6 kinase alpha-5
MILKRQFECDDIQDTKVVNFAMKVIAKDKASGVKEREALKTELRVMTELEPCPFLQKCHMAFESRTNVFFVVDLIEGGDIFSHLVNRVHCEEKGC